MPRPIPRSLALRTTLSCVLAAAFLPAAHADSDPWSVSAQETVSHDSNVFRSPGPDRPSDWISTTSLIGALDQPLGRQRLKLDGELDIDRFKRQHQLDSNAHSLAGELDWETIGHLSGDLGYSDARQLYRYNTDAGGTVLTSRNLQTTDAGFFHARLGVVTDWTLEAGGNTYKRSFSNTAFRYNDQVRRDASLGLVWRDTPDLSINLTGRRTVGKYTYLGDNFDRNDLSLGVRYAPTGASTFNASLGTARESHSLAYQRDTHLLTARLAWHWEPTGRTKLDLAFLRDNDTGSSESTFIVFPVVDTDARLRTAWSGGLSYALTSKIDVTATGTYANRQLDGSESLLGQVNTFQGSDRLWAAALNVAWHVNRGVDLSCGAARERRGVAGNPPPGTTYTYGAVVLNCSGRVTFR